MNKEELYKTYFAQGTVGFKIMRAYYNRNQDVFSMSDYSEFHDFMHEIYLNIAAIDFGPVEKLENYIIRSIRIQCWVIMEKSLRRRRREVPDRVCAYRGAADDSYSRLASDHGNPLTELAGKEIAECLDLFRQDLAPVETRILDRLIHNPDEKQTDAADRLGLNVNTLRTKIRRIRISLAAFLEVYGYNMKWGQTA